jgi:putative addiction module antidote
MTKEVTLRQSGGSVSATLPKAMADRFRLEPGDRVLAVETDRGILLTPYDPDVERALRVAAGVAKKFRSALRELAK